MGRARMVGVAMRTSDAFLCIMTGEVEGGCDGTGKTHREAEVGGMIAHL